jgi:hypothetical protein
MSRHMLSATATHESNETSGIHWMENDDLNSDTIDIDADGVFTSQNTILIDLSKLLSMNLGRQMSMMSTYRVDYLAMRLLNKDDANDNDSGASFSGQIIYWSPTKHRIDAMQLARATEKHSESGQIDGDSFGLALNPDYQGMRFNWNDDEQIAHPTIEGFTELAGSEWDLTELFTIRGAQLGLPIQHNPLWGNRCGSADKIGFDLNYWNNTNGGADQTHQPQSSAFVFDKSIEVLGGLIACNFTHSSTDSPINIVDDDYQVQVTIGVTGWSDF